MEDALFERLVAEALEALPEVFRNRLENVEIVVEDWPDRRTMRLAGVRSPADLLGFYHGVPLTRRTSPLHARPARQKSPSTASPS
jgi:predicted Zn-dependent protease with MMP-like domain